MLSMSNLKINLLVFVIYTTVQTGELASLDFELLKHTEKHKHKVHMHSALAALPALPKYEAWRH